MEINDTLDARGARYGDFTDHAAISDSLINICSGIGYGPQTNFSTLDPVKRQAIRVICDKLGRILAPGSDPEYTDNWHDIQGYAKLAEDRCIDYNAKAQIDLDLGKQSAVREKASCGLWGHPDYDAAKYATCPSCMVKAYEAAGIAAKPSECWPPLDQYMNNCPVIAHRPYDLRAHVRCPECVDMGAASLSTPRPGFGEDHLD
jgi:hypothetical protein